MGRFLEEFRMCLEGIDTVDANVLSVGISIYGMRML